MPIDNPTALVEEFKKSGEFDRVRRELLLQFQQHESYPAFKARVEDIARQRLTNVQMLQYLPQETVYKELTQEVERYPIVERAVADVRMFSDPTFLANVQGSLQKILHDEKGGKSTITKDEDTAGSEKTRTPVIQSSADHTEKVAIRDAQQCDNAQEHSKPEVSTGSIDSSKLALESPEASSTSLPLAPTVSLDNQRREDQPENHESGVLKDAPAGYTNISQPSSDSTSSAKSNNDMPIDDQQACMDIDVDVEQTVTPTHHVQTEVLQAQLNP